MCMYIHVMFDVRMDVKHQSIRLVKYFFKKQSFERLSKRRGVKKQQRV